METVLNRRLASGPPRTFEFVERAATPRTDEEPGLQAFLQDPALGGDATAEEITLLKTLTFRERRPTPLYYYRELQNLRDPLDFQQAPTGLAFGNESSATLRDALGRKDK